MAATNDPAGGFTGDTVTLHPHLTRNAAALGLLLRFSRAFKTGVASIHFVVVRSRSPDTAVSGFSRLKVVVGPAVTVEGNTDAAGARGLRGSSSHDYHSSVHVTTRDHTPVQSFESSAARPPSRVSLLLVFCFWFLLGCYGEFECVTMMMMNECDSGFLLMCFVCKSKWWCDVETVALRMGMLQGWIGKPQDWGGERVFRCVEDANRVRMNEQRRVRIGGWLWVAMWWWMVVKGRV